MGENYFYLEGFGSLCVKKKKEKIYITNLISGGTPYEGKGKKIPPYIPFREGG